MTGLGPSGVGPAGCPRGWGWASDPQLPLPIPQRLLSALRFLKLSHNQLQDCKDFLTVSGSSQAGAGTTWGSNESAWALSWAGLCSHLFLLLAGGATSWEAVLFGGSGSV